MYNHTLKQKQQMFYLCVVYAVWQIASQWMMMIYPFIQWDADPPMEIVHIGLIHTFGGICSVVGAFLMGQFIDLYGIKSSFLISIVLTSVYYVAISYATSFNVFMFAQIFRLGFQLDHSVEMYVATTTSESDRTNAMLKLGLPIGVSLLVSPILAGKLSTIFTFRTVQMLDGVFLLVCATPLVIYALPETHDIPARFGAKFNLKSYAGALAKNARFRKSLLLRVAMVTPLACYEMITRQYMMRNFVQEPQDAVYMQMALGFAVVVTNFLLIGTLQRRFAPKQILQISLTGLAVAYALVTMVTTYGQLIVVTIIQVTCYSLAFAEVCAQLTGSVVKEDLGKATGLAMCAQWCAQCVVPIATAYVIQNFYWKSLCYASVLLTGLTVYGISVYGQFLNSRVIQLPLFQS